MSRAIRRVLNGAAASDAVAVITATKENPKTGLDVIASMPLEHRDAALLACSCIVLALLDAVSELRDEPPEAILRRIALRAANMKGIDNG